MARKTVHTIYGLYDPDDENQVRYVGYTHFSPEQRIIDHVTGAKKFVSRTHKQKWIRKLLRKGIRPAFKILEITTAKDWKKREQYWIKELRAQGHRLTNSTEGGEGLINPSKDVRERISKKVSAGLVGNQRRKGKQHSPETIAKFVATRKTSKKWKAYHRSRRGRPGRPQLASARLKISRANKGRPRPDLAPIAKAQAKKNRGSFWVNNGIENRLMRPDDMPPVGFVRGRLMKRQMSTKNRRYVTNGEENRMISVNEKLPKGFRLGQTKSNPWTPKLKKQVGKKMIGIKAGYRWIARGDRQRQLPKDKPLPNGWRFVKTAA